MGYLIQPEIDFPVKKIQVSVPDADLQTLDTIPYELIAPSLTVTQIPFIAYFNIDGQTAFTGFQHLYLGDNTFSDKYSLIEELSIGGQFDIGRVYAFANFMTHPPNRFGIRATLNRGIYIGSGSAPTAGSGDMYITIYYLEVSI